MDEVYIEPPLQFYESQMQSTNVHLSTVSDVESFVRVVPARQMHPPLDEMAFTVVKEQELIV